jgi:chromosome segregation ATPase
VVTLLLTFPGESIADGKKNNRNNKNNRNRQQAAAKARAQAAAQAKQLTVQLKVVNGYLSVANQRLAAATSQMQALHNVVGQMRQQSDALAAEALDARNEIREIEKQLKEQESPGSKLGRAKATFEIEKAAYEKMRKEMAAKFDRKLSATERDKQIDADLGVVFKRKVMFASHTQLEKIRLEVFQKSPDWKNAKEVVELSSAGSGTAKRNLGTQISGYNKVKHVVLGVRRDVVALVQTKQALEIKKASAQKQARSGGSSAGRSRSGKKK